MDIKDLKGKLSLEDIIIILENLGAEPKQSTNLNVIQCKTVCHNGDSHKLYLYKDSLSFHCYTHCGSMDIVQVVSNVLHCTISQSVKYIMQNANIQDTSFRFGFGQEDTNKDLNILDSLLGGRDIKTTKDVWQPFNIIDESILNKFYDYYHESFYKDNISFDALRKFEIKYDILNQRVIIPVRYSDGTLIAIRCRNLDMKLIESGMKYIPITHKGKVLSAPASQYFYGLYHNEENIKRCKTVVLFEAEKSVMQYETMFPNANISLALSSSNLSNFQVEELKRLGVEEVVIALDKEFELAGTKEEQLYLMKIQKTILKKLNFCRVSLIWDVKGLLNKKDSPTDKGKEIFLELYKNRRYLN